MAFGDAKFAETMKGVHFASLARRCKQRLKEAEASGEIVIAGTDEYYTSQVYSKPSCRERNMVNMNVEGGGTLHAVKACNRYFERLRPYLQRLVLSSPFSAARNMAA